MKDTNLDKLIINKLTKSQYENLLNTGKIQDTQLYITTDEDIFKEITGYSTTGTLILKSIDGVLQWVTE